MSVLRMQEKKSGNAWLDPFGLPFHPSAYGKGAFWPEFHHDANFLSQASAEQNCNQSSESALDRVSNVLRQLVRKSKWPHI